MNNGTQQPKVVSEKDMKRQERAEKLAAEIMAMKLHEYKTYTIGKKEYRVMRVPHGFMYNDTYVPDQTKPDVILQEIDPRGRRDKQAARVLYVGGGLIALMMILLLLAGVIL